MSILASLAKAYERLSMTSEMPLPGYSAQNIHGCIVLNPDGTLNGPPAIWERDERGRLTTRSLNIPYFGGRSGKKPPPYFLWDNTAYVLGVTAKEGLDASERFEAFKSLHESALADSDDVGLMAVLRFLRQWNSADYERAGFGDELLDKNFVFRLAEERVFVHERPAATTIWQRINAPDTTGEGLCLVSGERGLIARLHPPLTSFENPARIVAFDKDSDAFASYGHVQGDNAPTSIQIAFAYSAALNKFLSKGSRNRIQIGDASTVFWADASDAATAEKAENAFVAMFEKIDENIETSKVGGILERIRKGQPLEEVAPELSRGVRFHVLGLAPNAARLSIRFWFDNDFGVLTKNYQRFSADMRIDPLPEKYAPSLGRSLLELIPLTESDRRFIDQRWVTITRNLPDGTKRHLSLLAADWMRAILNGTPYPLTLFSTVLMRLRADGDANALRVAILRALLIRNFGKNEKEAPVALDPDNKNRGYLLGRLFAVYEYAQTAALGRDLNSTIKDKFYGAASCSPSSVFALLERGSVNHLSKIGKERPGQRVNLEKRIAGIMDSMNAVDNPFPTSLAATDQALFGLGYYHQRSELFLKPESREIGEARS